MRNAYWGITLMIFPCTSLHYKLVPVVKFPRDLETLQLIWGQETDLNLSRKLLRETRVRSFVLTLIVNDVKTFFFDLSLCIMLQLVTELVAQDLLPIPTTLQPRTHALFRCAMTCSRIKNWHDPFRSLAGLLRSVRRLVHVTRLSEAWPVHVIQ